MAFDAAPPALEIEGVSYAYGGKPALHALDLVVPRGQIFALLGSSASGKTTLLNIVAGLLAPASGVVKIAGAVAADGRRVCAPPEKRGLGMVFQDYALWPHMSVGGNVAFPLEMRGVARNERRERVARALSRVGLAGFERRMPSQLSGGQQQRAALARAIVGEPSLVLFDEPLSNLDRVLREQLAQELAELVRDLGLTALYVTHDHAEAFLLADRIVLLRHGRIVQNAAPEEILGRPADADIAAFLNLGAFADAELTSGGWKLRGADLSIAPAEAYAAGPTARILIPHRAASLIASEGAALHGTVLRTSLRAEGVSNVVRLAEDGPELTVSTPFGMRPKPGDRVGLALDSSALRWFSPHADGETPVAS